MALVTCGVAAGGQKIVITAPSVGGHTKTVNSISIDNHVVATSPSIPWTSDVLGPGGHDVAVDTDNGIFTFRVIIPTASGARRTAAAPSLAATDGEVSVSVDANRKIQISTGDGGTKKPVIAKLSAVPSTKRSSNWTTGGLDPGEYTITLEANDQEYRFTVTVGDLPAIETLR